MSSACLVLVSDFVFICGYYIWSHTSYTIMKTKGLSTVWQQNCQYEKNSRIEEFTKKDDTETGNIK